MSIVAIRHMRNKSVTEALNGVRIGGERKFMTVIRSQHSMSYNTNSRKSWGAM